MNSGLYGLVVLIWGTTWYAIAVQCRYVAPLTAIVWRFVIATMVMWLIIAALRCGKKLAWRDHGFCMLQAVFLFSLNYLCIYTAVKVISGGLEAVLFSTAVLFNAANAWIFFRQRPPKNFVPAALLGLGGMMLIFWEDVLSHTLHPEVVQGIFLCVLGTYFFSLGNMISSRHQRKGLDIFTTTAYAMTYGVAILLVLALIFEQSLLPVGNWEFVVSLFYLAVPGSVVGFVAYFMLIGRIGASKAAYTSLLFPLVALVMSTLFEHQHWSLLSLLGMGLIFSGNLLMFRRAAAKAA